jgi:hypothetical protein
VPKGQESSARYTKCREWHDGAGTTELYFGLSRWLARTHKVPWMRAVSWSNEYIRLRLRAGEDAGRLVSDGVEKCGEDLWTLKCSDGWLELLKAGDGRTASLAQQRDWIGSYISCPPGWIPPESVPCQYAVNWLRFLQEHPEAHQAFWAKPSARAQVGDVGAGVKVVDDGERSAREILDGILRQVGEEPGALPNGSEGSG